MPVAVGGLKSDLQPVWPKYSNSSFHRMLCPCECPHLGLSSDPLFPILSVTIYYSEPFRCILCGHAQMAPIFSPERTSCSRLLAWKVRCSMRRCRRPINRRIENRNRWRTRNVPPPSNAARHRTLVDAKRQVPGRGDHAPESRNS